MRLNQQLLCQMAFLFFATCLVSCSNIENDKPPDQVERFNPKTPEGEWRFEFKPIEKPQHVLFLTQGWEGGGGDPVLVGPKTTTTVQYNGLPVYVGSEAKKQIRIGLGPQRNSTGRVLVEAKVHLEPTSADVSTNPPSVRSIYSVVIDELIHAEWYMP